jgi:hypothetical protein
MIATTLITTVGSLLEGWLGRHNRVAEAKVEAKIQNTAKIIDNAGWKDGFVILIWSIPAIMAFVPGGQKYAEAGFDNLAEAPEWYIVGWVSLSFAIYGIKPMGKKITAWRKERKAS